MSSASRHDRQPESACADEANPSTEEAVESPGVATVTEHVAGNAATDWKTREPDMNSQASGVSRAQVSRRGHQYLERQNSPAPTKLSKPGLSRRRTDDGPTTTPGAVSSLSPKAPSTNRGLSKSRTKSPPRSPVDGNAATTSPQSASMSPISTSKPGAMPSIVAPSTKRGLSKTRMRSSNGISEAERISSPVAARPPPPSLVHAAPQDIPAQMTGATHERWDDDFIVGDDASIHLEAGVDGDWDGDVDIEIPARSSHSKKSDTDGRASRYSRRSVNPELKGLVQAVPIQEESTFSFIPQAEEVDMADTRDREEANSERKRKERQCKTIGAIIVAICILVIILAVVFGTRRKNQVVVLGEEASVAPTASGMPSSSPSFMPSRATLADRLDIKGLSESTAEAVFKQGTPQQRAYDWTNEHPEFETMPNWRKQQLFALGTFHYSFDNWPDDYHWMDYTNSECFWTTELDTPEAGPATSAWRPPGYNAGQYCTAKSNCCPLTSPNPFVSNCDDEGHFYYFKLRLSTYDGPQVHGTLPPEISLLSALTILDVRSAGITGTIPSEVGMLSLLTSLSFFRNQITGTIPTEIGLLPAMESLNLALNMITGPVPGSIGETNLTGLYLNENAISSSLPSELGSLQHLVRLDLQHNQITGPLPSEMGNCNMIERLDARNNSLSGLPTEVGKMISMEYLMLRNNVIKGTIPSEIGNLSSVRYLSLERNKITGTFPSFPSGVSLSKLKQFDVQDNRISGIPTEIGWLAEDIAQLDLGNNNITSIPSELFLLTSLVVLGLEGNEVENLPTEVGQMTDLDPCPHGGPWLGLLLSENQLDSIPSEFGSLTNLKTWSLANNRIRTLPDLDWREISELSYIDLSYNMLESGIPSELGLLQQLTHLDLSANKLTGRIPSEIGFTENISSCQISYSYGDDDTAELYTYESACAELQFFDLHNNSLTGQLPTEMGKLTGLLSLDLSFNKISGHIPTEFGFLIANLKEYNETLGDYVPYEAPLLETLSARHNHLGGQLPSELGLLTTLEVLDLSFNNLTGAIPSELGNLNYTSTQILLLGNNFTGTLPQELCPWHCIDHVCSLPGMSCSMTGRLEVDCSDNSLLDCNGCFCF